MEPYIITRATAITFNGKEIPLEIVESKPTTKPLKRVEEEFYQSLHVDKNGKDPIVRIKFNIKPFHKP